MRTLTRAIIEAAIAGFEQQKVTIDAQIAELRGILNGAPAETARKSELASGAPKKRRMSAAGRRAIAEAQRKRWAAARGGATDTAPATKAAKKTSKKRKLSPEGRAAIVAAAKKRWAAKKAA
jgi:hypothetical protein